MESYSWSTVFVLDPYDYCAWVKRTIPSTINLHYSLIRSQYIQVSVHWITVDTILCSLSPIKKYLMHSDGIINPSWLLDYNCLLHDISLACLMKSPYVGLWISVQVHRSKSDQRSKKSPLRVNTKYEVPLNIHKRQHVHIFWSVVWNILYMFHDVSIYLEWSSQLTNSYFSGGFSQPPFHDFRVKVGLGEGNRVQVPRAKGRRWNHGSGEKNGKGKASSISGIDTYIIQLYSYIHISSCFHIQCIYLKIPNIFWNISIWIHIITDDVIPRFVNPNSCWFGREPFQ